MRVLLTGVSGQLGAHVRPLLAQAHEVIALDRTALDLADPKKIPAQVAEFAPQVVVNPAAYTAVDKAETERDLAFRVNADAPAALAQACKAAGALLIHYSTDYVFDGNNTRPWRETDPTAPLGGYGASKRAGEEAIMASGCDAIVLRTSWVYSKFGKNFLLTMQRLARERDELRVVADQLGTPNWAGTLAQATAALLQQPIATLRARAGLYHLSSTGVTSWHGFASAIIAAGERPIPVHPIRTEDYPTPAKRPAYSALDGSAFTRVFNIALPSWQSGLQDCLAAPAP